MLGAAGLAAVALVTGFAVHNSNGQSSANDEITRISGAMSNQWNADMMHDALRADVMSAMYATTPAQRDEFGVAEVTEHGRTMLEKFDAAAALAPESLRSAFAAVRPDIIAYGELAADTVKLAGADRAAAERSLADFLAAFSALEESLGGLDDAMVTAVTAAVVAGKASGESSSTVITWAAAIATLLTLLVCGQTIRVIRQPLRAMGETLRGLAGRDLTVQAPTFKKDEFGQMSEALNEAVASLRETVAATADRAGTLSTASGELQQLAGELDGSAERTSTQARHADTSAEEVSGSVTDIMSATEELAASIREIAQQTLTAASTTSEATTSAHRTAEAVARLSEASREVGDIVKLITNIAEQTNLLALNATIEAARAGEMGKGFAVVATEVKDLARETAQATGDITAKIHAIQEMTTSTAQAIGVITEVIGRIDESQSTIAAAVEEQSATTDLLARNVGAIQSAASTISGTVSHITSSSAATAEGANTTRRSATLVSTAAEEIREMIDQFRY
ncbi:methyl-accepting chemotaxis protein [Actinoplanes philippinensis]|uniref:Methyl-accepting chemotaxis protein n=2 Tax=Actinoplanes philippinensis TaxID=35752 RepID=A0A1I2EMM5_9ACTN|nr:methyl-accepting chemotaxis protein [Actinoplanes philippinensis]